MRKHSLGGYKQFGDNTLVTAPFEFPLSKADLPASIQKFADPAAPAPIRTMAAKGLVPVRGTDLLTLLAQLSHDADTAISTTALGSLAKIPENIVISSLATDTIHEGVLHAVAETFQSSPPILEVIVSHIKIHDDTLAMVALYATESIAERIAANEVRLLQCPRIIEALYKNKSARMSTIDRLIDLAVRNGIELNGIPTFEAHAQAISGQLIVEASDEPLPEDEHFSKTVEIDEINLKKEISSATEITHSTPIDTDPIDGTETVKPKFKPLAMQIAAMSLAGKIRLAIVGSAAARAILIRDNNRLVAMAAVTSPMMTDNEAIPVAKSKEVSVDVLRFIGSRRDWAQNYELKRALVFNPKTPQGVALQYLSHLRLSELRALAKSRSVPTAIKNAARQQAEKREKKRRRLTRPSGTEQTSDKKPIRIRRSAKWHNRFEKISDKATHWLRRYGFRVRSRRSGDTKTLRAQGFAY